jgi:hypothetical protein
MTDVPHAASVHSAILVPYGLQGHALRAQPTYVRNIILCKYRLVAAASSVASAVYHVVVKVLFLERPPQVIGSVVVMVPVSVRDLMFTGRFRTVKCGANDNMKRHATSRAKISPVISPSASWAQHNARMEMPLAIAIGNPAIQRPHAPKARRLVTRMTGHLAPLFDFVYRGISHVALRMRGGQELVTGANLSLVPHSIYLAFSPQGITILAART